MTNIEVKAALTAANHIHANNDAVIADITRIVTNHEASEGKKRPFYIYCSATGAKLGMAQQVVYEKRLAKFGGDLLIMFATYKGREPKATPAAPSKPVKTEGKVIDINVEVITVPKAPAMLALPEPQEEVIEVPAEVAVTVDEAEAEVAVEG